MKTKWYPVPPYKNEGWIIVNEDGELIATFEEKDDCIRAVELNNENLNE
ncbi:MAG: hypothetical protein ACOCV9_01790 [Marinilabiliaceae bacterium]